MTARPRHLRDGPYSRAVSAPPLDDTEVAEDDASEDELEDSLTRTVADGTCVPSEAPHEEFELEESQHEEFEHNWCAFTSSYGIAMESESITRPVPVKRMPAPQPLPSAQCDRIDREGAVMQSPSTPPRQWARQYEYDAWSSHRQDEYDTWQSHRPDEYDNWQSHRPYGSDTWQSHRRGDSDKWQSHRHDEYEWQSHRRGEYHTWQSHRQDEYDTRQSHLRDESAEWQPHRESRSQNWKAMDYVPPSEPHTPSSGPRAPDGPPPRHLSHPEQRYSTKVPAGALWQAVRSIKEMGHSIEELAARDDADIPSWDDAMRMSRTTKSSAKRLTSQFREANFDELHTFSESRDASHLAAQLIGLGKGSDHRAAEIDNGRL